MRGIVHEDFFTDRTDKTGLTTGYQAIGRDGTTYVVKVAHKERVRRKEGENVCRGLEYFPQMLAHSDILWGESQSFMDQMAVVNEYVASAILEMLSHKTSTVDLTTTQDPKTFAVRSRFIEGYQDLLPPAFIREYEEIKPGKDAEELRRFLMKECGSVPGMQQSLREILELLPSIGPDAPYQTFCLDTKVYILKARHQLAVAQRAGLITKDEIARQISKIIMGSLLVGDYDIALVNLGFFRDASGRQSGLAKVDQGLGFTTRAASVDALWDFLARGLGMVFPTELAPDLRALRSAIGEISAIPIADIRAIIHQKISDLGDMGVNLESLLQCGRYTVCDAEDITGTDRTPAQQIEDYMVSLIRRNIEVFVELDLRLERIEALPVADKDTWLQGQWFLDIGSRTPEKYAQDELTAPETSFSTSHAQCERARETRHASSPSLT